MSKVRLLVGTKKGAFILSSDGKRDNWDVSGPHFAGWELYHLKGSPINPDRIYASQSSGWFGQVIQRSEDGGKTWEPPGTRPEDLVSPEGMPKGESNKFIYEGEVGTHKWYDGTQHPWSSNVFGTSNLLSPSPILFTPALRTPRSLKARTAASHGMSFPDYAKQKATSGNPVPAVWLSIPFSSTPKTLTASSSPSPPRALSAPMMAAKHGNQ